MTNGMSKPTSKEWLVLLAFFVLCFGAAGIGGAATGPAIEGWFSELIKPSWNPPNWLFGPVWTVLYAMIAISGWLVWRSDASERSKTPAYIAFGVQLALNSLWSVLFFGLHQIFFALIEIVVLWLAIATTAWLFKPHSRAAALMLLPYLAWVSFATFLNATIWQLNS